VLRRNLVAHLKGDMRGAITLSLSALAILHELTLRLGAL
jgi:hypothetical protein